MTLAARNSIRWLILLSLGFAFGAGSEFIDPMQPTLRQVIIHGVIAILPTIAALKTTLEKSLGIEKKDP